MDSTQMPLLLVQCKAYQSLDHASRAIANLLKIHSSQDFNIHISLPYSFLESIPKNFIEEKIYVGVESLLDADQGSFTGSIAGKMLTDAKAKFVMIGTAQDRTSHSATSNHLKDKIKIALENDVPAFICIGETLQEHQDKAGKNVLTSQLKECIEGLSEEELKKIRLVYNAEWISRTPWEAASPELNEAYLVFREVVSEVLHPLTIPSNQLIVAIPGYSKEVSSLIQTLQTAQNPFGGYSLGILGLSFEFLQPLNGNKHEQKILDESSAEEKKILPHDDIL